MVFAGLIMAVEGKVDEPIVLIGTLQLIASSIEISSICFSLMWLFCEFRKIMELFESEDGSR